MNLLTIPISPDNVLDFLEKTLDCIPNDDKLIEELNRICEKQKSYTPADTWCFCENIAPICEEWRVQYLKIYESCINIH